MSEKQSVVAHQIPFTKYPSLASSTALFGGSSNSSGGGADVSCNGWVVLATRFLPALVVVMFGYSFYVYCYLFCYTEIITFHSRRLGVVLMGVFTALTCIVLVVWAAVLLVGPGNVARVEQYDLTQTAGSPGMLPAAAAGPRLSMFVETAADEEEAVCTPPALLAGPAALPRAFACDSKGFPLWCSHCQSVKPDRVHHSSDLQKCVPRLDHHCAWLGATIGARNYRLFIQFLFYAALDLLFLTITLAIFFHRAYYRTVRSNNVYYIALFALAGTWLLLLLAFTSTHLCYIFANRTTLEQIRLNHNQLPMFNFASPVAGLRVVSRARRGDPGPYDLGGWYANWKDRMGATPLDWLLPFDFRVITQRFFCTQSRQRRQRQQYPQREFRAEFNPRLLALFEQRYASGEEGYLAYPALQTSLSILDRPGSGVDSSIRPIKSRQSLRNSEPH
ncbi:hypothetical protein D0Z00_001665 [Geotrichum galactomycetum]|uniref:Uncharacterized protein n=1 Tax=Geotrichum galactomycetum TaxID=27317 RepID=A0ACB6V6D5_9ASCO|nr:hypothetical protein D0Z00_001665 [Geotrichum candidum]